MAGTKPARIFIKKEKNDLYFCVQNAIILNKEKDKAKLREQLVRKGEIFMAKITADTLIVDCLKLNPDSAEILMGYGMHCLGCAMAHGETIGEAVSVHGKDLDELLEKLNEGAQE